MSTFEEDVRAATDRYMEGALEAMGAFIADMLRDQIEENGSIDEGTLVKSISWATAQATDRSGGGDIRPVNAPTKKGVLHVGSADPKAGWVEFGTGPHMANSEQTAEFEENIRDWASRHGWTGKDGAELTVDDVYPLIKKIRENGTTEQPFMRPVHVKLQSGAMMALSGYLTGLMGKEMGKIPKRKQIVDIKIDLGRF